MSVSSISPQELHDRAKNDPSIELIDVRTPAEYREVHATMARNVPLDGLKPEDLTGEHSEDQPLYFICRSGSRGSKACEAMASSGFDNAVNVEGGTLAWESADLPVVRGQKTMSLERQVRIAAGSLVVLGAVLALAVHPYFVGLSAFVGAGLVFAGITDTCGMGMLISKMPWNQVSANASEDSIDNSPVDQPAET
ncbi:rhodanese-like domain-containing protein [Stratiformator vulcanicus]|uniref:Inner membrane protein YgaP n=1 Tax=Stratiformator vulcanicus TaxID=2527980 RepID=A0A517QZA9_9PLAN|nr:rhodanese-like domain-containing protein [Stratiformator vulcanicus]QDT36972.1 Inner membrane protein YgaP [Stratiformator vulcanicus]